MKEGHPSERARRASIPPIVMKVAKIWATPFGRSWMCIRLIVRSPGVILVGISLYWQKRQREQTSWRASQPSLGKGHPAINEQGSSRQGQWTSAPLFERSIAPSRLRRGSQRRSQASKTMTTPPRIALLSAEKWIRRFPRRPSVKPPDTRATRSRCSGSVLLINVVEVISAPNLCPRSMPELCDQDTGRGALRHLIREARAI